MTRRQIGAALLLLVTGCVEASRYSVQGSPLTSAEDGHGYEAFVVERGRAPTRPIPIGHAELREAIRRQARDLRWSGPPADTARRLLGAGLEGEWLAEVHGGRVFTLVPVDEKAPVAPEEDVALRNEYLKYCQPWGGGDCLGLLVDGPYLRVDDRRTLAFALALDSTLGETRVALARELLDPRAVIATLVWMGAIYLAMWTLPEPTSKALAAALTVVLIGWLGLDTLHGLWDGWARLAYQAHRAHSFGELSEAGQQYAKVMGQESARALVMALITGLGSAAGRLARQVRGLPGYARAAGQAEAQGVPLTALDGVEAAAGASDGSRVVLMDGERSAAAGAKPASAPAVPTPDAAAGLTEEALAAKLSEAEATAAGQRLPKDLPLLERVQPSLEHPPAGVAKGDPFWKKYVAYFGNRLAELRGAKAIRPPRTWRSYLQVFRDFARGLAFQRKQAAILRAEAELPQAQRRVLKDFEQPRIEQNVGMNTGEGTRYADIVAVEQKVALGKLPRVETFSVKSRDFTRATFDEFQPQVFEDAQVAIKNYGGTADIRRPSLNLRGQQVPIFKVHLIYDAALGPNPDIFKRLPEIAEKLTRLGVEVRFE